MITINGFCITIENVFLLLFLAAWWFKLLLLIITTAAGIIFHFVKMKKIKDEKADVERQLLERNELLKYSKLSEQKGCEKLAAMEKNKTQLLSKINHEVRTPMNGVMGMVSLLDQTELTAEQREYTATIITSGEALLRVVNEIMMDDILEYSKIDSGKELEAKDFDLSSCIEEVLDVFAVKAAKAGIDLLYNIDNNVPAQIVGDIRRLRQILMNLVENSMRVTAKGEILINVQSIAYNENNRIKLQFEVRDTGAGMDDGKTGLLNDKFLVQNLQVNTNANDGMGLLICKKLVELMGGGISVKSDEQHGSVFTFTIFTKSGMQPSRTHVHAGVSSLEDKRILIVDDNITACEILKKQLEALKIFTSAANSGSEAEEILSQVSFDLVMTDLNMPGMDGIELAEIIGKKYPAMPVILLNPLNDERHKQCAELFGEVLTKPLKQSMLLNAILTQLRHKDGNVQSTQAAKHKLTEAFSKQYPLNILVAEDNPINQKWITKILLKLGYRADIVYNGKEVLEVVSTKQYDLILMDVQMPEMDGMEATRMMRLCLQAQPVVIAMTANVMQGDRQDCMQSGMDDYISKPVELNQLVGMLEKWSLLIKEKKSTSLAIKN